MVSIRPNEGSHSSCFCYGTSKVPPLPSPNILVDWVSSRLVVAINKFDSETYNSWRNAPENRYEEIKAEISSYTRKVGFKRENVTFVPISAWTGNNFLVEEKMFLNSQIGDNLFPGVKGESQYPIKEWYQGPTLWEALAAYPEPERNISAPLRITIIRHVKQHQQDNEIIVMGRILTGRVNVGDEVVFIPNFKNLEQDDHMTVISIEKDHQSLQRAIPGDIGMNVFMCGGVVWCVVYGWRS